MRLSPLIPRAAIVLSLLGLIASTSAGHILIFKDGYTIHGRIREPGEYISDPASGKPVFMTKGIFLIDADSRLISFSHHQVPPEGVIDKDLISEAETIKLEHKLTRTGPAMYPILGVYGAGEWGADWGRTIKMRVNFGQQIGPLNVNQRLTVLTPHYARVDAKGYNWTSFYSTAELDRATVRSLLFNYPEMKSKDPKEDPEYRLKVAQFFVQAGWYDIAEEELAGIEKDLPEQKDAVEKARDVLVKLKAIDQFEEIEKAQQAGRHGWAQDQLGRIPRAGMDDKMLGSVRALRAGYDTANQKLKQAGLLLRDLPSKVTQPQSPLSDAATVILQELDLDSLARLEPFLVQAQQAGRDTKSTQTDGKSDRKDKDPSELLALAVSGWLLGPDAAEANAETAEKLWKARTFALDYQRSDDASDRERKLKDYQSQTGAIAVDEMAQMLRYLPPPKPETELGVEPMRRKTDLPGFGRGGVEYWVQLPPEYRHSRPYPALIVLHAGGGDTAADMLKRIAPLATRHGYVVVAPEWEVGGNTYEHSTEENQKITDVILDLRRRFQIDSDRVFLHGVSEGGAMAFDVGLSHPDLFAGVLPMAAAALRHAGRYWANAQYLPFYVVDGTFSGDVTKHNQDLFKKWVPLGFPGIYVQYKGRGVEWYAGELPAMLEWMDHKKDRFKRATAVPELGRLGGSLSREFLSLRNNDTRFYWLGSEGLLPNQAVDGRTWRGHVLGGTLYGRIHEGAINISMRNHKKIIVWLAREMVDFSKPLTVRVNGELRMNNQRVQPSMRTLMEDLYQRGDRQRLYVAKLTFDR
jgi:acetyl esterase/lipase